MMEEFHTPSYQLKNLITSADKLSKFIRLNKNELEAFQKTKSEFRASITPYYASLMDPENPNCPIRLQAVPRMEELEAPYFSFEDPLSEDAHMPVPFLVHRYPDRVLFLLTDLCTVYCRHCTRKRFTGHLDRPTNNHLDVMIDYIRNHPEINDVLISGGDPLFGKFDRLEYVLKNLKTIPHLSFVRIGSRVPVTCPMLITKELCEMLAKYHPVFINTHFNHPKEITPESKRACEMLVDHGIPMGNQTVLLKGVNDNAETIKELNLGLLRMRVKPYYLLQCDAIKGSEHFRTPISTGIEIMRSLRGHLSGMAIPHFVIDLPGGGGKVEILPEYLIKQEGNEYHFKNYQGKEFVYKEIL